MRLRNRDTGVVVNVRDDKTGLSSAWEPANTGSQATADDGVPPKAGRGSSRDAWADYAVSVGVDVDDDMTRDDIIAAVEGN